MNMHVQRVPVNTEITFSPDEVIVSKTDLKGRITYANDVFCRVAEMKTADVLEQPHSIIRHPDMPRAIFKLLWETVGAGQEIFAYVKNMSATGRYYWVLAHVTPTFDEKGAVTGYHSNRRAPPEKGLRAIQPLYRRLLDIETSHINRKDGLVASSAYLESILADAGQSYDQYIWSIGS